MGLFNLIFTIGANTGPFKAGLRASEKMAEGFAGTLKGYFAGAFSVAAIGSFIRHVVDATSRIKDLSEQTGISTDEVQKADYALAQSGLSFEDLTTALTKLTAARREAVKEDGDARKAFKALGMSVDDVNNSSVRNFDIVMKMSRALSDGTITAKEQAVVMDILGQKAGKLAFTMRDLATIEPPKLISQEDIEHIDRAEKAIARLKLTATATAAGPTSILADILTGTINFGRQSINQLGNKISGKGVDKNLPGWMDHIAKVAVGEKVDTLFKGVAQTIAAPVLGILGKAVGVNVKMPWAKQADKGGPLFPEGGAVKAPSSFRSSGDQLTSVGNFLGSDPSGMIRGQVRSIQEDVRDMKRSIDRLANNNVFIKK